MQRKFWFEKALIVVVVAALILPACGLRPAPTTGPQPTNPPSEATQPSDQQSGVSATPTSAPVQAADMKVLQSQKPRIEDPQVAASAVNQVVNGNSEFAVNLYHQLESAQGNLFFSPYSISLALAMTYAGAAGQTATQMAQTLHYPLPQGQLHPAFNALDQQLTALGQQTPTQATDEPGGGFQLDIANSVWGQQGFPFSSDYLDVLAQNYGAGLITTDFQNNPEAARQALNDWVSQKTQDKIQDLFPKGTIDINTRLALANAIYFKAAWQDPFKKESTQSRPFHLLDGSLVDVPMMVSPTLNGMPYYQGNGYQAASLAYFGSPVSMVLVIPDQGKFDEVQSGLTMGELNQIFASLHPQPTQLSLPKFKVESTFSLADTLSAMGMPDAFNSGQADFSGMDGKQDLYITSVQHKAYVNVDEKGTEAAAATGVVVGLTGMPQEPLRLVVDRPFLFFIRDNSSGTILFVGRVVNPAS